MHRPSKRKNNQLRPLEIETNILLNCPSSCLIKLGNTHVICSATVEETLPVFLRNQGKGWLTAEYNMLPRASSQRIKRDAAQGKVNGRTQEIQRLIGRSLRAILDLKALGERQIIIDCDVINADGGTRCAAITAGYVALHLAIRQLMDSRGLKKNPIIAQVAAISCGVFREEAVLDLDYFEDSEAEVDGNFVLTSNGKIVEIQASAESSLFNDEQLQQMLLLAQEGCNKLFLQQNKTLLKL